jgi:hypothetical protein
MKSRRRIAFRIQLQQGLAIDEMGFRGQSNGGFCAISKSMTQTSRSESRLVTNTASE